MGEQLMFSPDSESVRYITEIYKTFKTAVEEIGQIEYYLADDPYSFLVEEIIGQMLSEKVATEIYKRLEVLCKGKVTIQSVSKLIDEEILSIHTSKSKVKYIRSLTDAVFSGQLNFEKLQHLSDDEALKTLTKISGIGPWTAKMYLIFVVGRENILPFEDGAFMQGYKWLYNTNDANPEKVKEKCVHWNPYFSIGARYCYEAVDMGLTKTPLMPK